MLIDTHAHIEEKYYGKIEQIIRNANANDVSIIINNGTDMQSNQEVVKNLSHNMYGAIGIHPENVETYQKEDIDYIIKNIHNPKIVAIGEIGLDYHYGKENRLAQIKLFETQLAIAENYNIPVIIHSRDATEDTINTLKKFHLKGVIHSFSGSIETAKTYLNMGFVLGVNGVITFKNCQLKEVYKNLTLNDFVLETDSPYLTPHPYRGTQNEPKYIKDISEFMAELYGTSWQNIAENTNQNALRIFDKLTIPMV